jgi:hypothetical protein
MTCHQRGHLLRLEPLAAVFARRKGDPVLKPISKDLVCRNP